VTNGSATFTNGQVGSLTVAWVDSTGKLSQVCVLSTYEGAAERRPIGQRFKAGAMPQTTISGSTMISVPGQGPERAENDPKQPVRIMHGGRGCLRLKAANCCRRAAISNARLRRGSEKARR
jgi:hypothetical protein